MKIKTFASMQKCQKVKSTQNKLLKLVLLPLKNDIDLEMTMFYQLGPVPWTLATADGSSVNLNKAKLLHNLEGTVYPSEKPVQKETMYI